MCADSEALSPRRDAMVAASGQYQGPPISLSLEEIATAVDLMTVDAPDGPDLPEITTGLIRLGVAMSVPVLNPTAGRAAMEEVLRAGGTHPQIQEVIVLVSALGVHTLFDGVRMAAELAVRDGELDLSAPPDEQQQGLRESYVGEGSYWKRFEALVPGFLDALLRISPAAYQGFFDYCSLPMVDPAVAAVDKELVAIATDATPAHRYLPTLRLHVQNALKLGAGRAAISQALQIGAQAPPHLGVP